MPAVLDTRRTRSSGKDAAPMRGAARRVSALALWRHYAGTSSVPNRRWTLGISPSYGRPEGLRCPRISMGPKRATAALVASEHGIEILSPDAVEMLGLDRGQGTALDPVTNSLLGHLEQSSYLLDREDLGVWGRGFLGHLQNQISKNSMIWYSLGRSSDGWNVRRNYSATTRR
jgi:hypothetical protein